jgi:hypothetical protein
VRRLPALQLVSVRSLSRLCSPAARCRRLSPAGRGYVGCPRPARALSAPVGGAPSSQPRPAHALAPPALCRPLGAPRRLPQAAAPAALRARALPAARPHAPRACVSLTLCAALQRRRAARRPGGFSGHRSGGAAQVRLARQAALELARVALRPAGAAQLGACARGGAV